MDAQLAAARIREALEAGPTPEWKSAREPNGRGNGWIAGPEAWLGVDSYSTQTAAAAALIAACSPDNLRALLAERDEMAKDAARLQARLDALDNLPAEDFIRKVARQMGPPPFDTWPLSHVCQQNADEAMELVSEYDRLSALTIKEQK